MMDFRGTNINWDIGIPFLIILLLDLRPTLSFTVYMPDFDFMRAKESASIQQRAEQIGFFLISVTS